MNIGVIVVLFNPEIEHLNALVSSFVDPHWHVVLVDNSPNSCEQEINGNVKYFHNGENVGIAEAQNIGLRYVFSHSINYAFLLDQDSIFTPEIAIPLYKQFLGLESKVAIGALGPSILCQFSESVEKGLVHKGEKISHDLKEVKQIISSGMLLSKDSFSNVGEKDSGLFIDGVDHEWCWRARQKGFTIYQSTTILMPHRQGDGRVNVLGITFKLGAPIRLYYQFRNILILSRRSYVPLYWKCRHIAALPLRFIVNSIFFPHNKVRGRFMCRGLWDGLLNRSGAISKSEKTTTLGNKEG